MFDNWPKADMPETAAHEFCSRGPNNGLKAKVA
jgi:hypothetical protein